MTAPGADQPLRRVLIGCRGPSAERLVSHLRAVGAESVAVFSTPDADQPWVDAADYAVYLDGDRGSETYLRPERVVEAAMDGGCDAVHPGDSALADDPAFHEAAARAHLAVIGADASVVERLPRVPPAGPDRRPADRSLAAVVVGDRAGAVRGLASRAHVLESRHGEPWVAELGPETGVDPLAGRILADSVALARQVGWVGVATLSWAVAPDGGHRLTAFSPRLPEGFELEERVLGLDLLDLQLRLWTGAWTWSDQRSPAPRGHGVLLTLAHRTALSAAAEAGSGESALAAASSLVGRGRAGPGAAVERDVVSARWVVLAPTRPASFAAAAEVLASVPEPVVPTNLDRLRAAVADVRRDPSARLRSAGLRED